MVSLFLVLIAWAGTLHAQFKPPIIPAPAPQADQQQPNPANPNQKVRVPRPNAPGPNDFLVEAITQDVEGPWRHLRGHVKLETQEMLLEADEVDYNSETGDAEARGHVRFEHFTNGDKIQCDHGKYNTEDETGVFYDVTGTSPAKIEAHPGVLTTSNPFYFQAKWAERIQERYVLHEGFITDCKMPRPWWRLTGPKFDVIPNERAIAYHSIFRIQGAPVFYFPALYKSLKKSPRKSGFLTPNVGHSSLRGYMFGIGYYWAINRSYDLLYRSQYFTTRGFAHNFDFRGKVRPGTDFNMTLYGVNDRGVKIGQTADKQDIIQKQGGVLFDFQGKSDLGDGWFARGEVNYLSSFLFRQSFTESFHEAIFSESHSAGYLTKHWSTFGFNLIAQRDENFQSVDPKDTIIIRRLPEVEFLSTERPVSNPLKLPLWISFDSSASLLHRTQRDFQTRQFVERIDFYPRVTTAFQWKGFSLSPSFAIRETQWGSSLVDGKVTGNDLLRSAREVGVEFHLPPLARIYDAPKWMGDKMKHVIETRAEYKYVAGVQDFNRVIRFDETEIYSDTNEVEVSVANRLYVKNKEGAVNEALTWEVSQRRYFDPTFGGAVVLGQRNVVASTAELTGYSFLDGPRHYSPVTSTLRIQQRIGLEWRTDYDPLRGGVVNSGLTADIRWSKYFFSAGHNQVRPDPVIAPSSNQFRVSAGLGNENRRGWNAGASAYYDYKRDVLQFATTQITYNTDCCGFSVQFRRFAFGTRNENQFRVAFAIANIGTFGTLKRQERMF